MPEQLTETTTNSSAQIFSTVAESSFAHPFVKWAGGKGRLIEQLRAHLPAKFNAYFEPFMGGAALFFALKPERATLTDMSAELVNCYQVVRNSVEPLITQLQTIKHSKRTFYKIRAADRRTDYWTLSAVERAARFIYLNKTCFNGLYRVNSRGEFNVPFGSYKKPNFIDSENLRACSVLLQQVKIERASFENVLHHAQAGDFVYFDPPYVPLSDTASFTAYDSEGFTSEDQIRLRDVFRELTDRKVNAMLSNSNTSLIRQLYAGFNIHEVLAPRAINSKAEKRGKISELVVTNY